MTTSPSASSSGSPPKTRLVPFLDLLKQVPGQVGELIGSTVELGEAQYVLEELLDAGGMGEVYLATRVVDAGGVEWLTSERVAVKVVRRDLAALLGGDLKPFLDEARLHLCLDHPNVVHAHGIVEKDRTLYLVMEYLEGWDLRALLQMAEGKGRRISEATICNILARVADALDYVHRATDQEARPLHIVHRDVSPSNVRVTTSGEVKLVDFGVAFSMLAGRLETGSSESVLKGKVKYLSPEQANRQRLDGRSDLFSLGSILVEMLTGRNPFDEGHEILVLHAISTVTPEYVEQGLQGVPEELKAICHKLLALNPPERYQTGREVAGALRAYALRRWYFLDSASVAQELAKLETLPERGPGEPPPRPAQRGRRSFFLLVAGAALISGIMIGLQLSLQRPPRRSPPVMVESIPPATAPVQEAPVNREEQKPAVTPKKKTRLPAAKKACAAGMLAATAACQVHIPTKTITGDCKMAPPPREVGGHQLPSSIWVWIESLEGERCREAEYPGHEPPLEPCPAKDGELIVSPQPGTMAHKAPPEFLEGALLVGQARIVPGRGTYETYDFGARQTIGRLHALFTQLRLQDGTTVPICGVLFDSSGVGKRVDGQERKQEKEGLPVLDPQYYQAPATPTTTSIRIQLYWP